MKKIILSVLVLALVGAAGTYYYAFVYSKNRKFDMVNAEAMTIEASALVKAFQDNEAEANKNYLDKVLMIKSWKGMPIIVEGRILEIAMRVTAPIAPPKPTAIYCDTIFSLALPNN